MSLNDLTLSAQLITELYKNCLIETEPSAKPSEEKKLPWNFAGKNEKNILIITEYKLADIPESDTAFLTRLLKACNLTLDDAVLINRQTSVNEDYAAILQYFKSQIVFLFGVGPEQFGFPFKTDKYQVQHFDNLTILYCDDLATLQNDESLKRKIWANFKKIFNL